MTAPVRLLQPLIPGLVLYLPFWEGVGTFAEDISPFRNNGTIVGATWVNGVIGKALSFNGANNYVSIPRITLAGAYTFAIWLNRTNSLTYDFMFGDNGNYGKIGIGTNGYIWVRPASDGAGSLLTMNGIAPIPTSEWVFLAITRNVAMNKIYAYVNNIQYTLFSQDVSGNFFLNLIGNDNSNNWFLGILDEVRIFNRDLTPAEVWEEYYRGARMNY